MDKKFLLKDNLSLLESNKRESFDGMRAYHESERSHLQNALQMMWRNTLPVVVVPNAALLIQEDIESHIVIISSFITLIIAYLIVRSIYKSAKEKIIADNSVYNMFGKDYAKTCELLQFLEPVEINGNNIQIKGWPKGGGPGTGKGYDLTVKIVRHSAYAFISIPILYFCIVLINSLFPIFS